MTRTCTCCEATADFFKDFLARGDPLRYEVEFIRHLNLKDIDRGSHNIIIPVTFEWTFQAVGINSQNEFINSSKILFFTYIYTYIFDVPILYS